MDFASQREDTIQQMSEKLRRAVYLVLYNDGNIHIRHKGIFYHNNRVDFYKARDFFKGFERIYTTNYDLILDDIVGARPKAKVLHLHGGFSFPICKYKGYQSICRDAEYVLIYGNDSEDKQKYMRGSNKKSIFMKYLRLLETEKYDELHIWGYSGLNDQHINRAVGNNKSIGKIFYYTNPNEIVFPENEAKISYLFLNKHDLETRSWDEMWANIRP